MVHLQGGIGNQLFIFFAAKYFEENLNKKVYFLSETKNKLSVLGVAPINTEIILPKIFLRFIVYTLAKFSKYRNFSRYIYFSRDIGYEDIDKKMRDIRFISGYFQSHYYYENYTLANSVNNQIVSTIKFPKNYIDQFNFDRSVAIHIRRGDYTLLKNNYFGLLSAEYYRKTLLELQTLESIETVYLFSDSVVSSEFINKLKINEKLNIINTTNFEQLNDIGTLLLFSKFARCIISNSTFSWWGAYLGRSNKIVVAPSKWFKVHQDPNYLYPSSCLKSGSQWET